MTKKQQFKAKPIKDQVMVVTGASSGIGLATAQMAARRGAKVVLAARNLEALTQAAEEINLEGGDAVAVEADVTSYADILRIRDAAIKKYGRIDTWVNNAGTAIYGYLMDSDVAEERRLFDTNFWGARMGSAVAIDAMRDAGGVLINLGSEASVAAQPLVGMYSATKHALKAFTDALRTELKDRGVPVEVSLVRPTAIDTPLAEHGLNRLPEGEPSLPAPMYHPNVAAEAIVRCAENPQRDVYVGGPARLSAILETFFPRVKDIIAETKMKDLRKGTRTPHTEAQETLDHPAKVEGEVRGNFDHHTFGSSLYTELTTRNLLRTLSNNLRSTFKEMRKGPEH